LIVENPAHLENHRMKTALRIAFHHLTPSAAIEENIRKRIDKLCLLCDRSTGCRVTVEAPPPQSSSSQGRRLRSAHRDQRAGPRNRRPSRAQKPGRAGNPREADEFESAESRRPSRSGARGDVYAAVRDAFDAAGRKLADYVSRRNDALKAEPVAIST